MNEIRSQPSLMLHYRDRDRGIILMDRQAESDMVFMTDTLLVTDSGKKFVPTVRVPKLGYMARRFLWWPFGRRWRVTVYPHE
jgi:hypothetical protein